MNHRLPVYNKYSRMKQQQYHSKDIPSVPGTGCPVFQLSQPFLFKIYIPGRNGGVPVLYHAYRYWTLALPICEFLPHILSRHQVITNLNILERSICGCWHREDNPAFQKLQCDHTKPLNKKPQPQWLVNHQGSPPKNLILQIQLSVFMGNNFKVCSLKN